MPGGGEQGGRAVALVVADLDRREPARRKQRRDCRGKPAIIIEPVGAREQGFGGFIFGNARPGLGIGGDIRRIAQDEVEAAGQPLGPVADLERGAPCQPEALGVALGVG